MTQKLLVQSGGVFTQYTPVVSGGSTNSGQVPALNSAGTLDASMLVNAGLVVYNGGTEVGTGPQTTLMVSGGLVATSAGPGSAMLAASLPVSSSSTPVGAVSGFNFTGTGVASVVVAGGIATVTVNSGTGSGGGGGASSVPLTVASGATLIVSANSQVLYALPIVEQGGVILDQGGVLVGLLN